MLNGKVIAVTGCAGRIGSAVTEALARSGCKLLLGDIDTSSRDIIVKGLPEGSSVFSEINVSNLQSIKQFIKAGLDRFGRVDGLVHAAYPKSKKWGTPFGVLTEEGLREDLFSQLGGSILVSQEFFNYFNESGHGGNLVHISSIQGIAAPKFEHYEGTSMVSPIEYSAIKAGVIAITRYLAKYAKGTNVRVNCISPGGIEDNQPQSFVQNYSRDCVSKGLLEARDIVGTVLFLLSDDSAYITGQNIVIDDGWSL